LRGTCLASRETSLASIEIVGSWIEVRSIARISKANFFFVATGAIATETLLCFYAWSAGLPPERSSSNFSWSKWMTKFSTVTGSGF